MDTTVSVDTALALAQWTTLVDTYRGLGHRVDVLDPVAGLPDMVFAANGATVIDALVLQARFAFPERHQEAAHHRSWHRTFGASYGRRKTRPARGVNEAEGDFAVLSDRILAGYGFRTALPAHRELARLTGREVVSLELVDPRFYHLDVALTVLDDSRDQVAYYPPAFSDDSRKSLEQLFPDALIASDSDAAVLGLNCVSDGLNVFVPAGANQLMTQLETAGYRPTAIDLGELIKGGGSVKCCTQEIRPLKTERG